MFRHDPLVHFAFGCHPHNAYLWNAKVSAQFHLDLLLVLTFAEALQVKRKLEQMLRDDKCIAVGECGLDYSAKSRIISLPPFDRQGNLEEFAETAWTRVSKRSPSRSRWSSPSPANSPSSSTAGRRRRTRSASCSRSAPAPPIHHPLPGRSERRLRCWARGTRCGSTATASAARSTSLADGCRPSQTSSPLQTSSPRFSSSPTRPFFQVWAQPQHPEEGGGGIPAQPPAGANPNRDGRPLLPPRFRNARHLTLPRQSVRGSPLGSWGGAFGATRASRCARRRRCWRTGASPASPSPASSPPSAPTPGTPTSFDQPSETSFRLSPPFYATL